MKISSLEIPGRYAHCFGGNAYILDHLYSHMVYLRSAGTLQVLNKGSQLYNQLYCGLGWLIFKLPKTF